MPHNNKCSINVCWMEYTFHTQRSPIQPSLTQNLLNPQLTHLSPSELTHLHLLHPQLTQLSCPGASHLSPHTPSSHSSHALSPHTCPLTPTAHTALCALNLHATHCTPLSHPVLSYADVPCSHSIAGRWVLTFRIKEIILRVWHIVNASSLAFIYKRMTCPLLSQSLAGEAIWAWPVVWLPKGASICLDVSPDWKLG